MVVAVLSAASSLPFPFKLFLVTVFCLSAVPV